MKYDLSGYKFNPDDGMLEHPCGFLTSWFRQYKGQWFIKEWACDMMPSLQRQIVEAVTDGTIPLFKNEDIKTTYTRETHAVTHLQQILQELYLEYVNDYLTIEKIAEHEAVPPELMKAMVDEGKLIYEQKGCLY